MSAANPISKSSFIHPRNITRMLFGATIGALFGYGFITLAIRLRVPAKTLIWSDSLAIWMGITFLGMAFVCALISTNRRSLAQSMEGEDAVLPATNEEVRSFRLQAAVLALAGVMLLAPILSLGWIAGHPGFAVPVYIGIVVLFAGQTALNVRLWRTCDEFAQRTMLIVAASTFAIGQGLLFLWAAAERMHLVPALTGWDVITLVMTCYLAVGLYVSLSLRHKA